MLQGVESLPDFNKLKFPSLDMLCVARGTGAIARSRVALTEG